MICPVELAKGLSAKRGARMVKGTMTLYSEVGPQAKLPAVAEF